MKINKKRPGLGHFLKNSGAAIALCINWVSFDPSLSSANAVVDRKEIFCFQHSSFGPKMFWNGFCIFNKILTNKTFLMANEIKFSSSLGKFGPNSNNIFKWWIIEIVPWINWTLRADAKLGSLRTGVKYLYWWNRLRCSADVNLCQLNQLYFI